MAKKELFLAIENAEKAEILSFLINRGLARIAQIYQVRRRIGFLMLDASAFAVLLRQRLRRNQLPSSLLYFAGGDVENSYDGQDDGQAMLDAR